MFGGCNELIAVVLKDTALKNACSLEKRNEKEI